MSYRRTYRRTHRPRLWQNGLPTQHAIFVFTMGDCWALAIEIARITPLKVYLIDGGSHWVAGDGRLFVDITGVKTRQQLLKEWDASSMRLADEGDLRFADMDARVGTYMFPGTLTKRRLVDAAQRVVAAHSGRLGLEKAAAPQTAARIEEDPR